ncbi:sulfatase-like hydrolase/transferase [Paenibacillus sp. N1-5-1-14]|uniref:sulfatase-like hydrolase/transferase n=1 Tax=Paenibacillus radicibacter TaxID=2972488 RepID=UPI002158DE28|nr:sulfatase-like hydrolase/transferase [Paenibacillus radicibacter]MCR8642851.1 sulfatase-like hydrolase/transferase [Paenibacillus radicibacter]
MKLDKPNFLVFVVDQERYPPVYESPDILAWSKENLPTQERLRQHGMEFHRHYIGSAACCPSRATMFTGHYPSLHGVSQTNGIAKQAFDSDMFWLDRNTVPTMGDYFRAAGYQTYYKGKWHISHEDLVIPGTHDSLNSYNSVTGVPEPPRVKLYEDANRLDDFGFSTWVGPEPHGADPRNSASSAAIGLSGRDVVYGEEASALIEALDHNQAQNPDAPPWLVVASFLNPHDIVLYGAIAEQVPLFNFALEPMPDVPPPPTQHESLHTKPRCQASYRDLYPLAVQPIPNHEHYRKLYFQLQKNADQQMHRVFEALTHSSFYDNTIVIFTSDHGELLGAHGNLHQKMYCAYEEVVHVPFIIHNPQLFKQPEHATALTSHLDLLPTMLGLANIDIEGALQQMQDRFSEAQPFVGRNLSQAVLNKQPDAIAEETIYFMTDDDITRGQHQINVLGIPYPSVVQPNHIETIITPIQGTGPRELWKLCRYFDNPQFWSDPNVQDCTASGQVKTTPEPDEYELYNLTQDPLETINLANPTNATPYTTQMFAYLKQQLDNQRNLKRQVPQTVN